MNVIQNIKALRLEKGIPQKILSDALNVDVAVISNIENGKRELKVSELEIIANCLNVRVIDLFTYPQKYVANIEDGEPVEAVLQIKLKTDKRDKILSVIFGDNSLEILNK